jgi:hypothetical protein
VAIARSGKTIPEPPIASRMRISTRYGRTDDDGNAARARHGANLAVMTMPIAIMQTACMK